MNVRIFARNILIGFANIEIGDYYMGGLYGVFTPNEYYLNEIQKYVQVFNEESNKDFEVWNSYAFKVKLIDGYVLDPLGGITIEDFDEMFDEPIQITLAGVACNIIDKYFNVEH